jgi:hypothetical protein
VRAVSRREAERLQGEGIPDATAAPIRDQDGNLTGRRERVTKPVRTQAPPVRYRDWRNTRTGRVERVPVGIDPGWDTNPAKARLSAFVPPERDEPPPTSFPPGTRPPPLPPPRAVPATRLLESGAAPEVYARRFLAEFGADVGREAVHVDQVGQALVIGDKLFKTAAGRWKSTKRGRERMMLLLADTVKEPDEIWWSWIKVGNDWQLYRQYIARWQVAGQPRPGFAMFQWGQSGWSGVTTFGPDQEQYLAKHRRGRLAWRRKN